MVNKQQAMLDSTFAALADPTRRAILERLASGDLPVTTLAAPFNVSLPAISKQLRVLERAGLVTQEKDGRVRRCQLQAGPLKPAVDWIEGYRRFWDHQIESLASYLEDREDPEDFEPGEQADDSAASHAQQNSSEEEAQ